MSDFSEPILFLYGPPGSGKTSTGRHLAKVLNLPFVDLDHEIAVQAKQSIPEIFAREKESGFRVRESAALTTAITHAPAVIALGGGSLLDPRNRAAAEQHGVVICLTASRAVLAERVRKLEGTRPLLGKAAELENRLEALLAARAEHYASFAGQVDTQFFSAEQSAWEIQVRLGMFQVTGMGSGYDVRVSPGSMDQLGNLMRARSLAGPVALVSDEHVGPLHAGRAARSLSGAGYSVARISLPAGEANKSLASAARLWEEFLRGGLERGSTVVALGGGVITDLAGYAAAAYLRGVRWVSVPTSLLGMIDASLGGKTAIDLPQGKNLVGAFHPPALVLADTDTLHTLPTAELRNGLAEVLKHGVLRDPGLFAICARGWDALQDEDWNALVRRAMAVKVQYIQNDPYEKGERAALNLGHTIGHAIEQASHYSLRHGEAVSIGMVAAARLAIRAGMAEPGLVEQIRGALAGLGLPVSMPEKINESEVLAIMQMDKKKRDGKLRFVLPVKIGEVRYGVPLELDPQTLREVTQ
jgi:shikimate kinase/3-dehydroquinate synthase